MICVHSAGLFIAANDANSMPRKLFCQETAGCSSYVMIKGSFYAVSALYELPTRVIKYCYNTHKLSM